MPPVICRHGTRIMDGWWECTDCVRDNGLSNAEVKELSRNNERLKQEIRQSKNRIHEKTPEENSRAFTFQIIATFWAGFWLSLLVGVAGCSVRAAGFRQDNPFYAFLFESVIFYVLFLIWGIRDAIKLYGRK